MFFLQRIRIARNADRCNSQSDYVRPSICLTVTFRCFVKTNEDTIVRSSASDRTIILLSEEVKSVRIFAGITLSEGAEVRHFHVASENLTNNRP